MKSMDPNRRTMRFLDISAHRHHIVTDKLGRAPAESLRAMTGYGLSEREIARYYGLTVSSLSRLRRALDVCAPGAAPVRPIPHAAWRGGGIDRAH